MMTPFAANYFEARQRFKACCAEFDLNPVGVYHPLSHTFAQPIAMDWVRFGPVEAQAVVFITSGVHGTELVVGSAIQLELMRHLSAEGALPPGVAVVMVHGINPVGCARLTRTNEDNIDLNRNFCDFTKPRPSNHDYEGMHWAVCPAKWQGAERERADQALDEYIAQFGLDAFTQRVLHGQFTHPDGLFYGGTSPSWSNLQFQTLLAAQTTVVEHAGIIDLHSGVGERGALLQLEPAAQQTHETLRAAAQEPIGGQLISSLGKLAHLKSHKEVIFEYGTLPFDQVLDALRGDNWLTHHGQHVDPALSRQIKQNLKQALLIDDPQWFDAIWQQTCPAVEQFLKAVKLAF
jgi:hypothetical protein